MAGVKAKASWKDTDKGWKKLRAELEKAKAGAYTKVGLFGDARDRHAGDPVGSVELGVIHEFGAPNANIPARSFLRRTVDNRQEEIFAFTRELVGGVYDRKLTIKRALGLLGTKVEAMMKATIVAGVSPKLAASTIAAKLRKGRQGSKGAPKPLIDTGRMLQSITHEVVMGGGKSDE